MWLIADNGRVHNVDNGWTPTAKRKATKAEARGVQTVLYTRCPRATLES